MSSPSFERLRVWHEARGLVRQIYQLTRDSPFSRDFAFRDQIRRAALSVMSNIAEGYERGGRKEFLHFLSIARASAAEVRSQLYAAEDIKYLTPANAGRLRQDVAILSRQIDALAQAEKRAARAP
jgi:four helix bundle protein